MVSGPVPDILLPGSAAVAAEPPAPPVSVPAARIDLARIAYYRDEHTDYMELRNELLQKIVELRAVLFDLIAERIDMRVPD